MRIRAIQQSAVDGIDTSISGPQVLAVGVLALHLKPEDGVFFYSTENDYATCDTLAAGDVISTHPEHGAVSIDLVPLFHSFVPSSPQGRSHWRRKPFLCLDKDKALLYDMPNLLATALHRPDIATRPLQDCVKEVFRPDLELPTLSPVNGYVYLFAGPDSYKIGMSVDPARRLIEVSRQVGADLEIIHQVPSNDALRSEVLLHRKYAHARLRGEWFSLTKDEVEEFRQLTTLIH
jgi:hypothetical protein